MITTGNKMRNKFTNKDNKGFIISETTTPFEVPKILKGPTPERGVIIKTGLQDIFENRNKRLYTYDTLDSGRKSSYVQERLATKSWYGEAGRLPFIKAILCLKVFNCWEFLLG